MVCKYSSKINFFLVILTFIKTYSYYIVFLSLLLLLDDHKS